MSNLPYEMKRKILRFSKDEDVSSIDKAFKVKCEELLKEIQRIDKSFSLSGYLRKIKREKRELDKLKKTLAWKIYALAPNFYVRTEGDDIVLDLYNLSEDTIESLELILGDINSSYTISGDYMEVHIKLVFPYLFLMEMKRIDEMLHPKQPIITSYRSRTSEETGE